MADDKNKFGDDDQFGDSGLGNLPPLSDFDSQSGFGSDSDSLPPLSGFDTPGGLPPLSDIESETPLPRSPDQGKPINFDSGPATIATPAPGGRGRTPSTGFQDIAADSDFSPETPEIGPGPDSNVDTPMFDSAFGGGDQDFDMAVNTPAPTQAMETPMFGEPGGFGGGFGGGGGGGGGGFGGGGAGGGFGFDDNAFAAGTPAPDFSPDTEVRRPGGAAFPEPAAAPGGKKKKGGGLGVILAAVIFLIIGLVGAPFVAEYLPFLPNPMVQKIQDQESQITQKDAKIKQLEDIAKGPGGAEVSQETFDKLTADISAAKAELETLTAQLETVNQTLTAKNEELALVLEDLAAKSEEYALAQQSYEDLQNEMAIVQARQKGLASEVERLTNLVGGLEDANVRRAATKDALAHDVDRLLIQVKESLPLTPEKYSHDARVAAIETLRDDVANAKWVAPDLLEQYTSAYLKELEISQREEYFFAKMPVADQFGNQTHKWAEALMLGNRAVYFRSLDGKSIGIFANTGTAESPNWTVEEVQDKELRAGIEARVFQSRVPGFEQKIQFLAERELSEEEGTQFQRAFSSL